MFVNTFTYVYSQYQNQKRNHLLNDTIRTLD